MKIYLALPVYFVCSIANASPFYEFTPVERTNIDPVAYSGKPITILGIEPRMPIASVEKILGQEFKDGSITKSMKSFGGRFNGESVQFAPYVSEIVASKRVDKEYSEDVRVYFSSPTMGQRAVSITRTIVYDEGGHAPAFDMANSGVMEKYGSQPNPSIIPGGRIVSYANVTKGGKKTFCKSSGFDGCSFINAYQAELANQYISQQKSQNGLVVLADLTRGVFSENKLGMMSVRIFDFDFAIEAARADLQELQTAGSKKMAEPNKNVMPKL